MTLGSNSRGRATRSSTTNYVVNFPAADLNSIDPWALSAAQTGYTGPFSFSYPLPANHTLDSVQQQTLTGPSLGATLSFFRGGFFSDGVAKTDFLNLNKTSTVSDLYGRTLNASFELPGNGDQTGCILIPPQAPSFTITKPLATITAISQQTSAINFIVAENLGYHFDLPQGNWIEPLIGARYSYSTYGSNAASLGLEDGHAIRVQGGAEFGFTRFVLDRYVWTTSLTTLLYSDVLISGFVTNADGFSAGALLADQGKLRVQGALTSKVDLLNGVSTLRRGSDALRSGLLGHRRKGRCSMTSGDRALAAQIRRHSRVELPLINPDHFEHGPTSRVGVPEPVSLTGISDLCQHGLPERLRTTPACRLARQTTKRFSHHLHRALVVQRPVRNEQRPRARMEERPRQAGQAFRALWLHRQPCRRRTERPSLRPA